MSSTVVTLANGPFRSVCALYSCLGLGVGGNLPVDGTLFLEFLPNASGNMLTLLSVWWPVGQLISSLLAWAFIPSFSCASPVGCTKSQNWGWRYLILTLGAITFCMFIARFFFFHLYESPKYLLSRGRQEEAVASVHGIAYKNKTHTWLTNEILNEIGGYAESEETEKLAVGEIVRRFFSKFSLNRIRAIFVNKRLGVETILLWFIWASIGMGYPLFNAFLPQYLARSGGHDNSTYTTYRNYAITSIVGVPGSFVACYTVEKFGRKPTMAFATLVTGVLLFCFTISPDSNVQLAIVSSTLHSSALPLPPNQHRLFFFSFFRTSTNFFFFSRAVSRPSSRMLSMVCSTLTLPRCTVARFAAPQRVSAVV